MTPMLENPVSIVGQREIRNGTPEMISERPVWTDVSLPAANDRLM